MENLRNMIDVNTVIGDTIETKDGTNIIPISKVTFGFASGGSEFNTKEFKTNSDFPFGGGSGAGVTVKPIAFLIIKDCLVKLIPVEGNTSYDRLIDSIPQFVDNIKNMFVKKDTSDYSKSNITVNTDSENDIDIEINTPDDIL